MTNLDIIYKIKIKNVTQIVIKTKPIHIIKSLLDFNLRRKPFKIESYKVNISDDIKNGSKIRLKGEGYVHKNGNVGDIYIEFYEHLPFCANNCIYDFYINNKFLRNLTQEICQILTPLIYVYLLGYCIITPLSKINYIIIGLLSFMSIVIDRLGNRVKIENICPKCSENRAITSSKTPTGRSEYKGQGVEGDYKYEYYSVEYKYSEMCRFCEYYAETISWETESRNLGMTEEAMLRKQREENERHEKAMTEAYSNAMSKAYEDAIVKADERINSRIVMDTGNVYSWRRK